MVQSLRLTQPPPITQLWVRGRPEPHCPFIGGLSPLNSRSGKLPCVLSACHAGHVTLQGAPCWWTILVYGFCNSLPPNHLCQQMTSETEENAPQSLEINLLLPPPLFFPDRKYSRLCRSQSHVAKLPESPLGGGPRDLPPTPFSHVPEGARSNFPWTQEVSTVWWEPRAGPHIGGVCFLPQLNCEGILRALHKSGCQIFPSCYDLCVQWDREHVGVTPRAVTP